MAELKRNFLGARMNKDVDERLLKPGEYRDANNIEVSTSEGSNVGTVQTIKGNEVRNTLDSVADECAGYNVPDTASVVGCVGDPSTDKIYYFVVGPDLNLSFGASYSPLQKDYIIEYDTISQTHKFVFVDIYKTAGVNILLEGTSSATNGEPYVYIEKHSSYGFGNDNQNINTNGLRIGMSLTTVNGYESKDDVKITDIELVTISPVGHPQSVWKVSLSKSLTAANCSGSVSDIPLSSHISFTASKVLNFTKDQYITAINILDGSIYWTDDLSEPKKVNIKRSIYGTGGVAYLKGGGFNGIDNADTPRTEGVHLGDTDFFHTRLVIKESEEDGFITATKNDFKEAIYAEEKHVTVIKRGPTQPLDLAMYKNTIPRVPENGTVENSVSGITLGVSMYDDAGELKATGDLVTFSTEVAVDFRQNDEILFSSTDAVVATNNYSSWQVKVKLTAGGSGSANSVSKGPYTGTIVSISSDVTTTQENWNVKLDAGDSLFEFKFPRFSYRYKYQDGEYSTFAPWSQVAFLPDNYNYIVKQGYNTGMVNQLRNLTLKGYFSTDKIMPKDVNAIDILYKEDGSPSVYVVKTISSSEGGLEWPNFNEETPLGKLKRGEVSITSDTIYSVVPSSQLLRPWDNVPKRARAQEISANRLIYGNYVQNFNAPINDLNVVASYVTRNVGEDFAEPSIKSLREYTVGIVYSDGYGRETPVLANGNSIKLPKGLGEKKTNITARIDRNNYNPPMWAKYFSYYIKETSTEYYNLIMDRWYDASDGSVWLSFPSSERNKVDEDSYIRLKKKHGSNVPSKENSRYKVLSIENEAPDAVRQSKALLGTLYNTNSFVGNSEEGYPLQGYTFFTVQEDAFISAIGDFSTFSGASGRSVRFGGSGLVSKHYTISSVSHVGSKYKIEVEGYFDGDVAFASSADTFATAIDDLYLEFYEVKTENKPEFDGRFFVKVNKDPALEKDVLVPTQDVSQLQISDSWSLRYLNNYGYIHDLGTGIPTEAKTIINDTYSGRDQHPSEYTHHTADGAALEGAPTETSGPLAHGVSGQDKYFWGGAISTGGAQTVPADSGIPANAIAVNPVEALNDGSDGTGKCETFWQNLASKGDFFIDGATAYSWAGGSVDRDGNVFNAQDNIDAGHYVFSDFQDALFQENGPNYTQNSYAPTFGGAPNTANLKTPSTVSSNSSYGLPSRGIWDAPVGSNGEVNSSFMDISWTGMGLGYDVSNALSVHDAPFVHQLSSVPDTDLPAIDSPGNYSGASDFITKLTTPGTTFRFQLDPDNTVYTVVKDEGVYAYDTDYWESGSSRTTGAIGIRNVRPSTQITSDEFSKRHYRGLNLRQRWTIKVTPKIGKGTASGYNPIHGTKRIAAGGPYASDTANYRRALHHDATNNDVIEILSSVGNGKGNFVEESAVWETEPKEAAELDIYYQASGLNPLLLTEETNEEFIPIGSTFVHTNESDDLAPTTTYKVTSWENGNTFNFTPNFYGELYAATTITFTKPNGSKVTAVVKDSATTSSTTISLHGGLATDDASQKLYTQTHTLNWSNCWSFGNGVESDRIRDDYNAPKLDNGVKVSSVIEGTSKEERRKNGLIWSGIYNSNSGINEINQFRIAEKITKDVNPAHGSIQKLYNRDTRLIMFCEDKILRAVTNKDALYNADGKPQLVASNAVVGDVTAYQGDFGISTNPESFAATPYSIYFTDLARGQVLKLTTEGIVSISDKGMKDYFSDYMADNVKRSLGTYDDRKNEFNLSLSKQYSDKYSKTTHGDITVSFSERSQGWTSFKTFIPQHGISLNNNYYTFYKAHMWKHHTGDVYNTFYDITHSATDYSNVTLILNESPQAVKSFGSINYEGSQAKVSNFDTETSTEWLTGDASVSDGATEKSDIRDGEYYNIGTDIKGWYVENIETNLQTCGEIQFKEKEGKWFGYPSGETTSLDNLDEKEFTVQGLGVALITHSDASAPVSISINIIIT